MSKMKTGDPNYWIGKKVVVGAKFLSFYSTTLIVQEFKKCSYANDPGALSHVCRNGECPGYFIFQGYPTLPQCLGVGGVLRIKLLETGRVLRIKVKR